MMETGHCMKSVRNGVFPGLYFPMAGLSTGKYRPKNNPYLDTSHAVGITDFYKLVITVSKTFHKKQKPKISHYRNYKTFDAILFCEELNNKLLNIDTNNAKLAEFTDAVLSILYKRIQKGAHKRKIYPCKQFRVHGKRSKNSNNENV